MKDFKDIIELLKKEDESKEDKLQAIQNLRSSLSMAIIEQKIDMVLAHLMSQENKEDKKDGPGNLIIENDLSSDITDTETIETNLRDLTSVKKTPDGIDTFLLYAPVSSTNYKDSTKEDNEIYFEQSDSEMIWYVDSNGMDDIKVGDHPVISVWVPKENIIALVDFEPSTSNLGEDAENEHKKNIKVKVKAGKYKIYQELK